ncbi:hypothetical protein skT53_22490 [Effusibacillus dendaii]|uniref:Uncharacterized protein n=1 Tax=Effusibacillus dendaii TaxID=2743772 RepID=A0A7I8DAZ9_9BACL|nr:hypothetical protein skT53_22490 [Effusibacillus dendaii]
MTVSDCCGAPTKVENRLDHPLVYDDPYVLWIPVVVCTKCGKVIGLNPTEICKDEEKLN